MGEKTTWWQPPIFVKPPLKRGNTYFWPEGAPWDRTVDAYAAAFATRHYVRCPDGTLERGYEKIVIYGQRVGNAPARFQHAARQLRNGRWTSKLGNLKDITHHSPENLTGDFYGEPMIYMRRPRPLEANDRPK